MPSEQEAAAAGFSVDDYQLDDVELWPENKAAFYLFFSLRTQWRHGFNGATGLDYMPLFRMLDDMDIGAEDRRQMFSDVQYCEYIALKVMHDNEPG